MSNTNDLRSMTKEQRVSVVLESFGYRPDRRMLADIGLASLEHKEQLSPRYTSKTPLVVRRVRQQKMGKMNIRVEEYLGEHFVPGTPHRQWVDIYHAKYFDRRDAVRAQMLKGEGEIVPITRLKVPADVLLSDHGIGLGL